MTTSAEPLLDPKNDFVFKKLFVESLPLLSDLINAIRHPEPPTAAWVAYFKHWREEATMNQITYPPVQQALAHLKNLSADEEARRLAFVRERALHDEISELQGARREGIQQGEALVLERLLVKRFGALSDETRQRLAQTSVEQLETWTDRLLDAPTLHAVFESH